MCNMLQKSNDCVFVFKDSGRSRLTREEPGLLGEVIDSRTGAEKLQHEPGASLLGQKIK